MSLPETMKTEKNLDERERTRIYSLLDEEVGFSPDEVHEYFAVTKKENNFVLKLQGGKWLEGATNAAMQNLVKKTGGNYQPKPTATFTIPANSAPDQPTVPCDTCKNDTSNGGDCHREHFHADGKGNYICERRIGTQEAKQETEEAYSLAASREGLGELTPVLLDAHGEIIDGFHRRGENAKWHAITVGHIDTPVKLELARLAVNFARRRVAAQELTQRITFLIKAGLKPDEIAQKTGIGRTTIFKYMAQDLKDQKKVEAGKEAAAVRAISGPPADHTVTTSDTVPRGTPMEPEHDELIEALDNAKQPTCPECQEEPVHTGDELPWVLCSKGHEWNLNTGQLKETGTYLDELETCSNCHLNVHQSRIHDGVCDVCRQKAAATAPTTTTPEPEQKPQMATTHPAAKPTKPVDYNAHGEYCPICNSPCSNDKYEHLKTKWNTKYPELFTEENPFNEKQTEEENPFDHEWTDKEED